VKNGNCKIAGYEVWRFALFIFHVHFALMSIRRLEQAPRRTGNPNFCRNGAELVPAC